MSPMTLLPNTMPLVPLEEDYKHRNSSYDEHSSKQEKKLCIITLCGYDLSFIFNGKKYDTINICPFEFTFTKERIWKEWYNIGFIPMNRNCLDNFKVKQELGVGRVDDDKYQELGNQKEEYNKDKERCRKVGLNTEILDIKLGVCNSCLMSFTTWIH